jgi:sugar phosphate isomerase/epimerase
VISVFVAASTRCFGDRPFDEACRQLEDLEFERLEVWIDEPGRHLALTDITASPDAFAARCREVTRIPVSSFCLSYEAPQSQFELLCKTAKAMRITQITMPAAPHGTPFNSEIDRLKGFVKAALLEGVRVSLKTEKGRLTEDLRTAVELCTAVPGLGLTYDPTYSLKTPDKTMELVLPRIFHVHLRDSTPEQVQVQVGLGEIDYSELITQLRRFQYNRALSVEWIPELGDPDQRALELRKLRMLLDSLL